MTLTAAQLRFEALIVEQVSAALGARRFVDLLDALPSIPPPDVVRVLKRLVGTTREAEHLLADAVRLATPTPPLDQGQDLPLPHPLDMEWRFTPETADMLLSRLMGASDDNDAVLLLGVPSVASAARHTSVAREFHVRGEGNVICHALEQVTQADPRFLHRAAPGKPASAALLDPPWYLSAYEEMLGDCSARCAFGATVLLILPPEGIRPDARADQARMLAVAAKAGFDRADEIIESVDYRTPAFELAAWRAAGIGAWLPTWRRGDLVTLVKRRPSPRRIKREVKPPAFELTIEGVRLKLLLDGSGPAEMKPLVPGEVVPSVSARFEGRDQAVLWTTTNRAFVVDPNIALVSLLRVAVARAMVLPIGLNVEEIEASGSMAVDAIRALTHQIHELVASEIAASSELVGETAWLRTLNEARFCGERFPGFRAIRHGVSA